MTEQRSSRVENQSIVYAFAYAYAYDLDGLT